MPSAGVRRGLPVLLRRFLDRRGLGRSGIASGACSGSRSGDEVLDVPCGHGRIANGLAARGGERDGARTLTRSSSSAHAPTRRLASVKVEYIQGDMRNTSVGGALRSRAQIGSARSVTSTTKGNHAWLREARKTLRDREGASSLELWNRDSFARNWLPVTMSERDGDLQVDRHRFRPAHRASRNRSLHRPRRSASASSVSRFGLSPSRSCGSGCSTQDFHGSTSADQEGEALDLQVRRMVIVATR